MNLTIDAMNLHEWDMKILHNLYTYIYKETL